MDISVWSEIGPLKAVLIHEPGREVDEMPPSLMGKLLFDDLLYGPKAREEHLFFRQVMEAVGAQIFDTQELLAETLDADPQGRGELTELIATAEGLSDEIEESLGAMSGKDLAGLLVAGSLTTKEILGPDKIFDVMPLPNLLFSRDPQTMIGKSMVFSAMKHQARKRESVLSQFIFTRHPDFKHNEVACDFSKLTWKRSGKTFGALTLEGGDVLVFNEGIVVAGVSERTTEYGIDRLADALREKGDFKSLIMVPMPSSRSQMHLDTIFTRVSEEECLVYGPMIGRGFPESLSAISVELTRNKKDYGKRHASLLDALDASGVRLKAIQCGGKNEYIYQSREQWTDGANSFALRPGMILAYDRNPRTIQELDANGYHVVTKGDFQVSAAGLRYDFKPEKKYTILLPSNELSRARGGPRCMTMPLRRDKF